MATLPDSLSTLVGDYNNQKSDSLLWIDKQSFNYGIPQPNTNPSINRNTMLLVSPKEPDALLGNRTLWYNRIDLSAVMDTLTVERGNATRIAGLVSQLQAYYNTRIDEEDYEDQEVFDHDEEFVFVAKPGSLRFINSMVVKILIPPAVLAEATFGDALSLSRPTIGQGTMIDVYQYFTSSLYAIYENSDTLMTGVVVARGLLPDAVYGDSLGIALVSMGNGSLSDTIAYKSNSQVEADKLAANLPNIGNGEMLDTISYKSHSKVEVDKLSANLPTIGNGSCLVTISYVTHSKAETDLLAINLPTIGNGTLL